MQSSWCPIVGQLLKAIACSSDRVWALTVDDEIVMRIGVESDRPMVRRDMRIVE